MGRPQWLASVAHQHWLGEGWGMPPLVFLGPRDQHVPLQTGARMGRHTFRLCKHLSKPQLLASNKGTRTRVIKPQERPHRPVKDGGIPPCSADTPCFRHSRDCKVFEDCLALDPLNTEEKEPQKYMWLLFKQLPHCDI